MAYLSGYTTRKAITIDNTNVDSSLTDFPLLVIVTSDSDIGAAIDASGYNIRFTSSDGETLLKYERRSFSVSGGAATGLFWVKVPTISGVADTTIYIYYKGGSGSEGADPTNVWDSGYEAVWHMDQDPSAGNLLDSTANDNDATPQGLTLPTLVSDDFGSAIDFGGNPSQQYFNAGDIDLAADITIEGRVRCDAANGYLVNKNFDGVINYSLCVGGSGFPTIVDGMAMFSQLGWANSQVVNDIRGSGNYHTVGGVYQNSGTNRLRYYVDGALDSQSTEADGLAGASTNNEPTCIGAYLFNANYWDGRMAEVRISSVVRSAAWLKFFHYNLDEADHELSFGDEEIDPSSIPTHLGAAVDTVVRRRELSDLSIRASHLSDTPVRRRNDASTGIRRS